MKELLLLLVGAILGHWLMSAYNSYDRRRAFRGFIRPHLERFESVDWKKFAGGELFQMHQDSVTAIADEAARILDDIPKLRRPRFNTARMAYRSLNRNDIEPYDLSNYPANAQAILFPRYECGIQRVAGLLKEMIEYAK